MTADDSGAPSAELQGHRHAARSRRRRRQGHRPGGLRRRRQAAGDAPGQDAAQPARARPDQVHRHEQGRGAARRAGRRHRRRTCLARRGGWAPEGIDQDLKFFRDNFLASDKVLYRGHPVAAVAAVDRFVAEEALELIDVEYEVLPPVLDVLEAMQDDARSCTTTSITESLGQPTGKPSNVATHFRHAQGRSRAGLRRGRRHRRARVPHRDGPPGLHRAARDDGRLVPATAARPSGPAPRARSAPERGQRGSWPTPWPRSTSSRPRSAAGSAARATRIWSRWPRCCPGRRAGRCGCR